MKALGCNKSDRDLLWSAHVYLVVPVLPNSVITCIVVSLSGLCSVFVLCFLVPAMCFPVFVCLYHVLFCYHLELRPHLPSVTPALLITLLVCLIVFACVLLIPLV